MSINVIKNVVRWTAEQGLPDKVRYDYLEKAQKYQRGESMPLVEEKQIAQILNEIDLSPDIVEKEKRMERCMNDRIMIVEDDNEIRKLLLYVLDAEGYEYISTFNNPQEALERIRDGLVPDILISDYNMPCINGVEMIETARQLHPEIDGLIITGNPDGVSDATSDLLILDKGDNGFVDRLIEAVGSRTSYREDDDRLQ